MLRALTLAALLLVVGVSGASARSAGGSPAVFVTVERSSQLVGVDLTTGRVIARIRLPEGPRDIVNVPGAEGRLLVTSPQAGAVTLVDAVRRRVVKVWRGFGYPRDVASTGRWAYVTDEARSQLVVIDLTARKIIARVAIRPAPINLAVGDVALLTHGQASARLTIAELSWTVPPRVLRFRHMSVGGPAHDVSRQGDTANAYVTYWRSGAVGGIDWGRGAMLWKRTVGERVEHVQTDYYHGRRLWVSDRRTGSVLALSSRDGRVLRRLRGCSGARGVAFAGTAWVVAACHDADALAIWDQRRWKRRLVRVGDGPHGVAEVVLP